MIDEALEEGEREEAESMRLVWGLLLRFELSLLLLLTTTNNNDNNKEEDRRIPYTLFCTSYNSNFASSRVFFFSSSAAFCLL